MIPFPLQQGGLGRRVAQAASGASIPTDNLVLHYTMDNIAGATLVDEVGSYNGTISGATTTAGKSGNALSFDGVNDYVDCGSGAGSTVTGSFTICLWADSTASGGRVYLGKYAAVPAFFEMGQTNDDKFYLRIASDATTNVLVNDPVALTTYGAGFQFLLGEYDGSVLRLYVNNALVASLTTARNASRSSDNLNLGRRSYVGAEAYAGVLLDQVRLYSRALTAGEKTALYNEFA